MDAVIATVGILYVLGALSHWQSLTGYEVAASLTEHTEVRILEWQKSLAAALWPGSVVLTLVFSFRNKYKES